MGYLVTNNTTHTIGIDGDMLLKHGQSTEVPEMTRALEKLTALGTGCLTGEPHGTFEYKWRRIVSGTPTPISGATASTYTARRFDLLTGSVGA